LSFGNTFFVFLLKYNHKRFCYMASMIPDCEFDRLRALRDLGILGTPPDTGLDTLVALTTRLFDVPIATVSLVDDNKQWFKARVGLDICETPRRHAFCAHTILKDQVLVVPDATRDGRFCDNPYVKGPPHLRAYAGAPIRVGDGFRIGALCILDTKPRDFSDDQLRTLSELADLVAGRLKLLSIAAQADERSRMLTEANRLAQRAQIVLGVMSDGVVVQDRNGTIVSANESACNVLGLSMDQLMGRTSVDPRWRSVDENGNQLDGQYHPSMVTLRTGKPVTHFTLGVEQPNAIRRWLRVSSRPLFEDSEATPSHAVSTFTDITEIVEKNQALNAAREASESANRAKSAFLANVSHEIRTPLNGVIGLASVLSKTSLSPAQQEMVDLIKTSGATLERLLTDILDVSKIEAGKLEMRIAPMDLQATITAAAQLIGLRAEEKGIRFDVSFGPHTHGAFMGDAIRIRQIISNLTSNSLKFTQKGRIAINVTIEDRLGVNSDSWLTLAVSDTGMGFDEETARRLFTRFEQADTSITRAYGGTGLGLSICKSLAEMMGGTIHAVSTPGIGSTFTVEIPLKRIAEVTALEPPEDRNEPVLVNCAGDDEANVALRVLVADDHPINQRVTSLCLTPWGAEITAAANGIEAVAAFQRMQFDIILMDMQMPDMDGLEATRQIRLLEAAANARRTPIAMLSANAMAEHVAAALEAGCDHHIAKPVTPEALSRGMEETMRRAELAEFDANMAPMKLQA
jgi:two-component system, sensor histidine kinase